MKALPAVLIVCCILAGCSQKPPEQEVDDNDVRMFIQTMAANRPDHKRLLEVMQRRGWSQDDSEAVLRKIEQGDFRLVSTISRPQMVTVKVSHKGKIAELDVKFRR